MIYLLNGPVEFEENIKKSRFLTQAVPVATAAEAMSKIEELSTPSATHNCWAWKIGEEYRFSDDGEPGGTAGRPMLAAIENQQFDQVLAVCTRWYGGIQLGTGGLARAYGSGVNHCLQDAPKTLYVPRQRLQGHCPYSEINHLKSRLAQFDTLFEDETFDEFGALFTIAVPVEHVEACQHILQQLTSGAAQFTEL